MRLQLDMHRLTRDRFYSTGIGFGYYTAYASYNAKNANAVQDSIIICMCNSLFEIACGFAIFCVVGFLGMTPENTGAVGSFTLGFITLPEALAQLPGAQVWSVIFFFTLFMLAVSSAFVQIDLVITTLCDTDRGQRVPRVYISTTVIVIAFLVSIIYCTEFGSPLLDAIDANTNNVMLPFVVFSECYGATVLYRMVDVVGQTGWPAVLTHQFGFLGGMAVGLTLAHTVSIPGGIAAGFGLFFVCFFASAAIAKTPDHPAPGFWGKNRLLSSAWWLAFYSVRLLPSFAFLTASDANFHQRANNFATTSTSQSPKARTGPWSGPGPSVSATSPAPSSPSSSPSPTRPSSPFDPIH
jgi:solute carrier family 6 GABA transporter-like protein 1